ncbi:inositol-phosphate phosphatase [Wohlfahrtiimonas chitiniclastica]|uniref:inositol monophosphatase family protein n=1 Tax=Wohlfahrtiimonas chitiniclastica TaxID=400946 RepID=UPI001BCCAD44|nr:inositol monophosphatase family protein [Wohlfahrtiimonas chitiniclastica]MBS7828369.1 inositol-phosphate phosphatase [Wohlfahrtiimonas chitiniclastica]
MEQFLKVALLAAQESKKMIRKAYEAQGFNITIKGDYTPVTEVDVNVETLIRSIIVENFPEHGFWGEEGGMINPESDYQWLIDPIDGTKAFIRRRPFFSTQIALMYKGEIILGVSSAPCFGEGEMAYATKGNGTFINGERVHVSDITELKDAVFSSGNIKSLVKDSTKWQNYGQLLLAINSTRGFGDFLHYHYTAAGKVDIVVESDVTILDVAALSIIVTEAGGKVTDLAGQPLSLESTNIVATNGALHDAVLSYLQ